MGGSKVRIRGGQKSFRKVFFIDFGAQNILIYIVLNLAFDLWSHRFYYFGGGAQHQGIRRDNHALRNHGVGADDAVFADLGVVKDGGMHANQYVVGEGSSMHDGGMADYAIRPDGTRCTGIGMDDGIVLDVCACAHGDGVGIAAKDGAKPKGGIFMDDDIADGGGVGCHEGAGIYLWGLLQFSQQFIGGHPFKNA